MLPYATFLISLEGPFANSVKYSLVGIIILVFAFILVERLTPKHNLWKEVVEKQNIALAIVAGFFMLAVAIIIASAIH